MQEVKDIKLRVLFNSFGGKTIEAVINKRFAASCPGGISKSGYETADIGAEKAIKNFYRIKSTFLGDFTQKEFDLLLKKNMNKLGSTLTTALSLAFFSMDFDISDAKLFPNILGNVLGGGSHSPLKKPEIQEFLVVPNEKTIFRAIETNFNIWSEVYNILKKQNKLFGLDPESACAVNMTNEDALDLVTEIANKFGAKVGIDFAASSIFQKGKYFYHDKILSRSEQMDYIIELWKTYNLVFIEDPLEENDYSGFRELKNKLKKTLICGDDLIASHLERLKKYKNSVNSVIVKPNQVGTVTECLDVIKFANKNKIMPVVSHRSKETCCSVLSKLSLYAPLAKLGIAGIRTAKLNELIRLWNDAKKPVIKHLNI